MAAKIKTVVRWVFNIITSIIVFLLVTMIFKHSSFGFFKKLGIVIAMIVVLDVLCFFAEFANEIYKNLLVKYNAQQSKRRKKKLKEKEESKKKQKEFEEMMSNTYLSELQSARMQVKKLRSISEKNSFKGNKKNINSCLEKLEDILSSLNEDSSGYPRVSVLFEVYLPEIYHTLELYSEMNKAGKIEPQFKEQLTHCLEAFKNFLEKQKVDAVFDKESTQIQFKASTQTIMQILEREDNKS